MEGATNGLSRKRWHYFVLAILSVAAGYAYQLWYYGGLYRVGALLSPSRLNGADASMALAQHLMVNLPWLFVLCLSIVVWKRQAPAQLGLTVSSRRGRIAVGVALAVTLGLLTFSLLSGKLSVLSAVYGWFYYLFLIAFFEELVFRAILPSLIQKSGLPMWCVWVIPALLFGAMHTLMPLVKGDVAAAMQMLMYSTLGYAVGGCAYYALYRWSGTLWLPIVVHGTLDYLAMLT